jgi:hypothetical protein
MVPLFMIKPSLQVDWMLSEPSPQIVKSSLLYIAALGSVVALEV